VPSGAARVLAGIGAGAMAGAMGSARHHFYDTACQRAGCEEVAKDIQRLWLRGARAEAAALVPDDPVLQASFLGTPQTVPDHIRAYRDAGATSLLRHPESQRLHERLDTLGRALDLVRSVDSEPANAGAGLSGQLAAGADTGQNGETARPS
jgi:Luciferase-like monooxygenase